MKTNKPIQQKLFQSPEMKRLNRTAHGGELRKKRMGRHSRPLSTKKPHHIVFKINKAGLLNRSFRHPRNFKLIQMLLQKYAKRFFIKVERISYQHDHIHLIARSSRRTGLHHFFRVFCGQIAQLLKVTDTPLWKMRPFSRILEGYRSYQIARDYLILNDLEVTGTLKYQKQRLKGLSSTEWDLINALGSQDRETG